MWPETEANLLVFCDGGVWITAGLVSVGLIVGFVSAVEFSLRGFRVAAVLLEFFSAIASVFDRFNSATTSSGFAGVSSFKFSLSTSVAAADTGFFKVKDLDSVVAGSGVFVFG